MANLKKYSRFCEFDQNLDSNIRDQFAWGLSSEAIKKKFLEERELTYHRAVELALSLESAGRDVAQMRTTVSSSNNNINFVSLRERTSIAYDQRECKKLLLLLESESYCVKLYI